jgi:hypothetical protein
VPSRRRKPTRTLRRKRRLLRERGASGPWASRAALGAAHCAAPALLGASHYIEARLWRASMASPGGSHAAPGEENWAQCADAAFQGLEAYAHPFNRAAGGLRAFDKTRPPHFSVLLLGDPRFRDLCDVYKNEGRFNKCLLPEFLAFFKARLLARHGLVKYTIGIIRVEPGDDVAAAACAHAAKDAFIEGDTPDPEGCLHLYDRLLVMSPAMSAARGARVKNAMVALCDGDNKCVHLREERSSAPQAVVYFAWQSDASAAADGGIGTRGSLGGAAAGGLDAAFQRMSWRPERDEAFPDVVDAHVHSFDRHNDSRSLDCFDRHRPQHFRVLVPINRHFERLCRKYHASDAFERHLVPGAFAHAAGTRSVCVINISLCIRPAQSSRIG